jgi:two-component system, LytTR family, response regulator
MRVLIVDDERLARKRIADLLAAEPHVSVEQAEDGVAAVERLRAESYDLMLLDVEMPEKSGFDVLEELPRGRTPLVIFVTAHDQYAVRAFEARAIDYLVKPVSSQRFREALSRAREQMQDAEEFRERLRLMLDDSRVQGQRITRFVIRKRNRIVLLSADRVEWIKAEGNYLRLVSGGEGHLTRGSIGAVEDLLDPRRFARIHRSFIVNLDCVREIEQIVPGEYETIMSDGARLPVGRTYRDRLLGSDG